MNRRDFVKTTGGITLTTTWLPLTGFTRSTASHAHPQLLEKLVKANDLRVGSRLANQIRDRGHRWFGGSPDKYGIPNASSSCALITDLTCAYVSPDSSYYKSDELLVSITRATNYLLTIQHKDGTVDLHTTNFHSPPDTAFRVEPLALCYDLLRKSDPVPEEVLSNLEQFLVQAAKALRVGGIHTPNHRWVVCMALAHIHHLFPNEAYVMRVNQWLKEGIDIDPDGQFTERSTTAYSPLVDRCLITMARLLDKGSLYEPVRKNLEMTLYYLRPNYELSTEASGRQDQYRIGTVARYHYPYRYMAIHDSNARFAKITSIIETNQLSQIGSSLIHLLQDPFLRGELPAEESIETDYVKYFKHSKLVRIRRGARDATILEGNAVVFSYFKGSAAITGLRVASAFFGIGQFRGDSMEIKDHTYILKQSLRGPYYQPLKQGEFHPERDSFGHQRASREQSEVQELDSTITLKESQGTFEIHIQIEGTDNVPVAVELGFRKGGELLGATPIPEVLDAYLLKEGEILYTKDGQTITVGPGKAEHQWTQLRGALPKLEGPSVYLTGYTPFSLKLNVS